MTWLSQATFELSDTSADDDDGGSDTEEGTEVDIEALEEDELFVQNLGRNTETIGRTGNDYEVGVIFTPCSHFILERRVRWTV